MSETTKRQEVATGSRLESAVQRFKEWRAVRPGKCAIPEELWGEAVGLVSTHGAARTARALGLNTGHLKERCGLKIKKGELKRGQAASFIEMPISQQEGCTVEFSDGKEANLKICSQAGELPDVVELARIFYVERA